MRPRRHTLLLLVLLLFGAAPSASAAKSGFATLYGLVPSRASGIAVIDHERLAKHRSAAKIRMFVHDQGGAHGLRAVVALGVLPGKDLHRSVTFSMGQVDADILAGPIDLAALEARAKTRLGKSFEVGETAGKRWFSVTGHDRLVAIEKDLAVVGSEKMVKWVIDRAAGKGKPVTKRRAFKAMLAPATRAKASAWGMGWTPKSVRRTLEADGENELAKVTRARFHLVGADAMTLYGAAYTDSSASAAAVKDVVEAKIDKTLAGSVPLKLLGVTALARQLALEVKGKAVTATMHLNAAQVDFVAATGGKVIAVLRSRRK